MKTIAEALVNERQKKNMTLEQIASRTNIKLKSLQALESGQFDLLPGSFYFKNYVKSYLRAIECDEASFYKQYGGKVDDIASRSGEQDHVYYPKLKYSRFKKHSFIYSTLIVLIMFGVIVALLFVYGGKEKIFHQLSRLSPVESAPEQAPIAVDIWEIPATPNTFNLDYAPVHVEIRFLKNCWTQVFRGTEKIVEKVFQQGETAIYDGYRYQIVLGNPTAVQFFLNNKEVTYLKALSRSEKIEINPATVAEILQK